MKKLTNGFVSLDDELETEEKKFEITTKLNGAKKNDSNTAIQMKSIEIPYEWRTDRM